MKRFLALLIPILVFTGCVTFNDNKKELRYPTGLSMPESWQHGATFYSPKPLRALALPGSYEAPSTPAKNQGQCGSCSHFASIAVYESVLIKRRNITADLSEQNVLNCAKYDNYKCNGSFYHGRHLVENGAPLDSMDPYVGYATQCRLMASAYEKPNGFAYVGQSNRAPTVQELREAIYTYGALWVTVYADQDWNTPPPVMRAKGKGQSNHAVVVVAYHPDANAPGGYIFKIKNSWSPSWALNGYSWIEYGAYNFGETAAFLTLVGDVPNPSPSPNPNPPGPIPDPNPPGPIPNPDDGVCVPAKLDVPSSMAVVKGKEVSIAVKPQEGFTYEWYRKGESIGKGAQIFYIVSEETEIMLVAKNRCGTSEVTIGLHLAASVL